MLLPWPRASCSRATLLLVTLLGSLAIRRRRDSSSPDLALPPREYDLAIFGATGYIGRLAAAAALGFRPAFAGVPPSDALQTRRVAGRLLLVGRDEAKLRALRDELAAGGAEVWRVGLAVADYDDAPSLERFVHTVRLVLNVATRDTPPLHEGKLAMQCARAGTHYVDVSNSWVPGYTDPVVQAWQPTFTEGRYELPRTITMLDRAARATGAVIGISAGCSSIPHEVAALAAIEALGEKPIRRLSLYEVFHSAVEDELVFRGPWWCGLRACFVYNPNITIEAGKNFGYVVRSDGTNAFPTNAMGYPISREVMMRGRVPVQQSAMEIQSFFFFWWDAKQLGWGNFSFEQLSPTNSWIGHGGYRNNPSFRKASKFTVVAEVEGLSGRVQSATHRQHEFVYEDTMRTGFEMAIALLYEPERVTAANTGGVFLSAFGWGKLLQEKLDAIGLTTVVEAPGKSAATILYEEMSMWGIL
ncbi:hypothetical protein AB1Y20_023489 [Prymnesium parvum]|uniref:Saccharopine dehydrogenase NADP binding domain-containing protein n=2 Tax=Prymnesium parvum TaxID=97485 RepID=A0AB34JEL1_PRYPA|mmetsp:Transcript_6447/g.13391  ORF Transcript_6447/g.13391 Transcript_6447/m.13391 type:complete len:472 (+) Transcript_6447:297-1712(+)